LSSHTYILLLVWPTTSIYTFSATSSKDDLHRRIGGRCSTHNMKVVFKVCCRPEDLNNQSKWNLRTVEYKENVQLNLSLPLSHSTHISTLSSDTQFFLNVRDQVSHPYRVARKIIFCEFQSICFQIADVKTKKSVLNGSKHSQHLIYSTGKNSRKTINC
jgi:hypothetical protein